MLNIDTPASTPNGEYNLVNEMQWLNNLTPEEMKFMFNDNVGMNL